MFIIKHYLEKRKIISENVMKQINLYLIKGEFFVVCPIMNPSTDLQIFWIEKVLFLAWFQDDKISVLICIETKLGFQPSFR